MDMYVVDGVLTAKMFWKKSFGMVMGEAASSHLQVH